MQPKGRSSPGIIRLENTWYSVIVTLQNPEDAPATGRAWRPKSLRQGLNLGWLFVWSFEVLSSLSKVFQIFKLQREWSSPLCATRADGGMCCAGGGIHSVTGKFSNAVK